MTASKRIRLFVAASALLCGPGLLAQEPPSAAQQPAQPPAITLNAGKLTVSATNSSLRAILDDLQQRTGAKVSGLGADQRVYGVYGPGNAQEVLAELLDDSGYNFVISGRQADGAPREIELSAKGSAPAAVEPAPALSQAAQDADENSDDSSGAAAQPVAQPMPPQNEHGGPTPSGQPKTVQQMLEELQAMHQQQQAQQANTPQ